jgi:bifunctional oligoribonuclease and PAP phosphatase NrnA
MLTDFKKILDGRERFLVATHVDPDGDALGSAFALAFALTALGKDSTVYLRDKIPYRYEFLPKPANMVHEVPATGYDAVIVVDCGDLFRVGEALAAVRGSAYFVNIDHHETNEAFGDVNIVDERASSTAEVLYGILKSLSVRFDFNIAVNLYTAVLTDTGSFRYESTTSEAFSICEEMTRFGVRPSYVAGEVYECHPKERFQLLRLVLETLETFNGDRIATAYVTQSMFERTGTNREYTEGFVEYLKEIRGVEVACLVREVATGQYKVSMRSKDGVDVASVASSFGGGGHERAAGCTITGDIEAVKNKLIGAFSL